MAAPPRSRRQRLGDGASWRDRYPRAAVQGDRVWLQSSDVTTRPRQAVRVDHIDRGASGIGQDLVEDVGELDLVFLARHVADVRCGDDFVDREEGVAGVDDRVLLVDVNRRQAWPSRPQGGHECDGPEEFGATWGGA